MVLSKNLNILTLVKQHGTFKKTISGNKHAFLSEKNARKILCQWEELNLAVVEETFLKVTENS